MHKTPFPAIQFRVKKKIDNELLKEQLTLLIFSMLHKRAVPAKPLLSESPTHQPRRLQRVKYNKWLHL